MIYLREIEKAPSMKLGADKRLSGRFLSTLAVHAKLPAEFRFGIVSNFLRDIGAAIVASKSRWRVDFVRAGLGLGCMISSE